MKELNCLKMVCPTPILLLAKEVKGMNPGEQIKILSDDPAFKLDIEAWTARTGNPLISFEARDNQLIAVVQKGKPNG